MTQTFTPSPATALQPANTELEKNDSLSMAEPSEQTLLNILNYSKNLEVLPSALAHQHIQYIKS